MNVIVINRMEHDVTQKPVSSLWHHVLGFSARAFASRRPMSCGCSAATTKFHGPERE